MGVDASIGYQEAMSAFNLYCIWSEPSSPELETDSVPRKDVLRLAGI
jgi:hypothetical protein